jgi:hypothetical protein
MGTPQLYVRQIQSPFGLGSGGVTDASGLLFLTTDETGREVEGHENSTHRPLGYGPGPRQLAGVRV